MARLGTNHMLCLLCRCVAQYGPTARSYDVGNRAGGQFDKLGQAMKRLLDAFVSEQSSTLTAAAAAAASVMALQSILQQQQRRQLQVEVCAAVEVACWHHQQ